MRYLISIIFSIFYMNLFSQNLSLKSFGEISKYGKQYCETPLTFDELLESEHIVLLSEDGYVMETKHSNIPKDQISTLSATLEKSREVTVLTKETGAIIYIDDKEVGKSPFNGSLSVGSHYVYAMLDGRKTKDTIIVVNQGTEPLPSVQLSFIQDKAFTVNGVLFTMIFVEGGTFTMGATEDDFFVRSDEEPAHNVTLSNYFIGETEVTQALWKSVTGRNPSAWEGDSLPVEHISWIECQDFICKLNQLTGMNFRLPTEAEWEYAARGGNKSNHTIYSGNRIVSKVACYGLSRPFPVKSKQPNELGIYDMCGNVAEWCQDWYDKYSNLLQKNPIGPYKGLNRVYRGGSFNLPGRDCRISIRWKANPESKENSLGFRLAMGTSEDSTLSKNDDVTDLYEENENAIREKNDAVPSNIRVDQDPEFPGGEVALMEFIKKNLRYPSFAADNGIQGRVYVSFFVEADGSLTDIQGNRSPSEDLTKEAKRLVSIMPKWNPGKKNGMPVRAKYVLPVLFSL